jgi:hypothetical protein
MHMLAATAVEYRAVVVDVQPACEHQLQIQFVGNDAGNRLLIKRPGGATPTWRNDLNSLILTINTAASGSGSTRRLPEFSYVATRICVGVAMG